MTMAHQRASNAAEIASVGLREALESGRLRPDDPVREEEWALHLGISRTPVREAIQDLVARGIFQRKGRTAYVFRPSLTELLEIYDIRLPLEQLAAGCCAELATPSLVDELEQRFNKIRTPRPDPGWYVDHEAFHMAIFEGSHKPKLVSMIGSLRMQSEPYVRFAVSVDSVFRDRSAVQHESILEAIRRKDRDETAAMVQLHLLTTRQKITDLMDAYGDIAPLMHTFGP